MADDDDAIALRIEGLLAKYPRSYSAIASMSKVDRMELASCLGMFEDAQLKSLFVNADRPTQVTSLKYQLLNRGYPVTGGEGDDYDLFAD